MPVVVFIHGGGFVTGDKQGGLQELQTLAQRGYFGATINYRLGSGIFPAPIEDGKTAVRFLRAHASEYGIDETKIGLYGLSAGGTLAALAGTAGDVSEWNASGGSLGFSSRVAAVVTWFGSGNLLTLPNSCVADTGAMNQLLRGCPISSCYDLAVRASPITYVTTDDPPFMILPNCRQQGEELAAALNRVGVSATLNLDAQEGNVPNSSIAAAQSFLDSILR
jgi:acetyl esterase/lipase